MFDIKTIEQEAKNELNAEVAKAAKGKIKSSLLAISRAQAVLDNLRAEHAVILRDVGSTTV